MSLNLVQRPKETVVLSLLLMIELSTRMHNTNILTSICFLLLLFVDVLGGIDSLNRLLFIWGRLAVSWVFVFKVKLLFYAEQSLGFC